MKTLPIMKTAIPPLLTLTCATLVAQAEETPRLMTNATSRFAITGMSCDGCARGIAAEFGAHGGAGCRPAPAARGGLFFLAQQAVAFYSQNQRAEFAPIARCRPTAPGHRERSHAPDRCGDTE